MNEKSSKTCLIRSVNARQWNSIVLGWAEAENWDMCIGDTPNFFNVDPNAFFIAYRDEQPIASISMVKYSDNYSFGGNFIIAPEFRHHVCAARIWKPTIAYAEHRTIGCDGNWDKTQIYEKRGFVIHYRNVRLSGTITQKIIPPAGAIPITPANIADVIQYDAECAGVYRDTLLSNWFWGEQRYGFCTYSKTGISGVIGIRKSHNGYRIGPFYADNPEAVETLALTVFALVPAGEHISVDVPETDNNDFLLLAHEYGLRGLFNTYRMYKGNAVPKGRQDKVKAISSLELG
ncbi:hypothetical protein ID853_00845 [Xenorhabdus sp. Vera]|uniref:hypothetical protein n=1 Tax=Xenorhabdus koppenhoeferi TaxID=351659 RepID=UPI0019A21D4F|nr:hypothetical protein [Xenorhabdus sp. Vera]MBD2809463.1 hypothetical protein [Xenorhabdus sp. Vera]